MIHPARIPLYDTALRDDARGTGVTPPADKMRIAERLDECGIDSIEDGWSGSNQSGDGARARGTAGAPENVAEASWQALVDGLEHVLLPADGRRPRLAVVR
jgi:isopropylmalate/homocitrate/citramalate synthase